MTANDQRSEIGLELTENLDFLCGQRRAVTNGDRSRSRRSRRSFRSLRSVGPVTTISARRPCWSLRTVVAIATCQT